MKKILILQCILILSLLSFCKDNKKEDNKQKTQVVSLLAVQMQNTSNTRLLTCSEANISDRIIEIANKYNQSCNQDSDCVLATDDTIRGYVNWGKSCYICISIAQGILKSSLETFKTDLVGLNSSLCKGTPDMSYCNKDCPILHADSSYCNSNKKCVYKTTSMF